MGSNDNDTPWWLISMIWAGYVLLLGFIFYTFISQPTEATTGGYNTSFTYTNPHKIRQDTIGLGWLSAIIAIMPTYITVKIIEALTSPETSSAEHEATPEEYTSTTPEKPIQETAPSETIPEETYAEEDSPVLPPPPPEEPTTHLMIEKSIYDKWASQINPDGESFQECFHCHRWGMLSVSEDGNKMVFTCKNCQSAFRAR